MMSKIIPVILCGGSGTRLWPLSRENMPKQFLNLIGDFSLLQDTVLRTQRVSGAKDNEFLFVTLSNTADELQQQLEELGSEFTNNILYEPCARNTAAAVALAARYVSTHFGADSIMWVLPADHHISDENALKQSLQEAVKAAKLDYLTTFGIVPSRPETGYGYIHVTNETVVGKTLKTKEFVEKPDLETAKQYIKNGNYLWNSGMFVFKTGTILENYMRYASDIVHSVYHSIINNEKNPSKEEYMKVPKIPFDTAIMERSEHVAVLPCDIGWSDIGSFESLWEISDKNPHGNVIEGTAALYNSRNCMVHAGDRFVTCAGIDDIVVIETEDAVLVTNKNNGDSMKVLVDGLKKMKRPEIQEPPRKKQSWGMLKLLSQNSGYKLKEITVNPEKHIGLQKHEHRSEFWIVVEGEATVNVNNERKRIKTGESVFIPQGAVYSVFNTTNAPLRFVEMQCGNNLDEKDVIKLDEQSIVANFSQPELNFYDKIANS